MPSPTRTRYSRAVPCAGAVQHTFALCEPTLSARTSRGAVVSWMMGRAVEVARVPSTMSAGCPSSSSVHTEATT